MKTNRKRISRADWEYIGKYNPAAKWLRPFSSYTLIEVEGVSAENVRFLGLCI